MMRLTTLLFLSFAAPAPAEAHFQTAEPHAERGAGPVEFSESVEGGWHVRGWHADDGEGFCAMRGEFRSGTNVDVVISGNDAQNFLFVFRNTAWRSITKDQELTLRFELTRQGGWTIRARGIEPSDGEYGFAFSTALRDSDGESFPAEFALASGMSIYNNGRAVDHFNLEGSRAGLLVLARCMGQLGNLPHYDPFSH